MSKTQSMLENTINVTRKKWHWGEREKGCGSERQVIDLYGINWSWNFYWMVASLSKVRAGVYLCVRMGGSGRERASMRYRERMLCGSENMFMSRDKGKTILLKTELVTLIETFRRSGWYHWRGLVFSTNLSISGGSKNSDNCRKNLQFFLRSCTVDVSILKAQVLTCQKRRTSHIRIHQLCPHVLSLPLLSHETQTNTTTVANTESEGCPKPPVTQTKSKVSRVGSLSWNHQPWLSLPGTESAKGCRDTWDEVTFTSSVYLYWVGLSPTHSFSLICEIQKLQMCWSKHQHFKLFYNSLFVCRNREEIGPFSELCLLVLYWFYK